MDNKQRARAAVRTRMAEKQMNNSDLTRMTHLDSGTVDDFLADVRWPRPATLAKLEAALQWPAGTLADIANGGEPPDVGAEGEDRRVIIDVDPETYSDLDTAELAEAVATAKATFLKVVRQIPYRARPRTVMGYRMGYRPLYSDSAPPCQVGRYALGRLRLGGWSG